MSNYIRILEDSGKDKKSTYCVVPCRSILYVSARFNKRGVLEPGSTVGLRGGLWLHSPMSVEEIQAKLEKADE